MVPVKVGANGMNNSSVAQAALPNSASVASSMTSGLNMAETLAQGPPHVQATYQFSVGTQRLEEIAIKQSKQLILWYGKIFSCNLLGKRAVVSADPSFNRFIMQNEGKLFQSSYLKSFQNLVGINGVINAQGEQQKKLHSIASNMMRLDKFSFHFMKDIQMVLQQTVTNFNNNEVIILQDVCRKVAINLMVNQLLGVSSESEVDEMAHLFSDFVDGCLSVPINFPGFAFHTAMKAREKIIDKIDKLVKKHREERKSGDEIVGNGLLGRLVDEESLADDTMADFVINLLFAGNETTAKTMLFAIYFLSQCPEAMKQLLEEQQTLKSQKNSFDVEDEMLTWQDYKAMPFTQCQVIDETLRLGGIAIWLMREAKQDGQDLHTHKHIGVELRWTRLAHTNTLALS